MSLHACLLEGRFQRNTFTNRKAPTRLSLVLIAARHNHCCPDCLINGDSVSVF